MAKKVVFVIAQDNFRDEELLETKKVLTSRGIETKVASKTRNKAIGKLGSQVVPDLALAEINVADFDGIIFVGGSGATAYFDDTDAMAKAQDFKKVNKVVAAICIGPSILANAGVLISKTVTAFPGEEKNLVARGAIYTGMSVEVDGNIVTARDPAAAKEFGDKLAFILGH